MARNGPVLCIVVQGGCLCWCPPFSAVTPCLLGGAGPPFPLFHHPSTHFGGRPCFAECCSVYSCWAPPPTRTLTPFRSTYPCSWMCAGCLTCTTALAKARPSCPCCFTTLCSLGACLGLISCEVQEIRTISFLTLIIYCYVRILYPGTPLKSLTNWSSLPFHLIVGGICFYLNFHHIFQSCSS